MNAESTFAGYISRPPFWKKQTTTILTWFEAQHKDREAVSPTYVFCFNTLQTSAGTRHHKKIGFQTQTIPSTFRPSFLKKNAAHGWIIFLGMSVVGIILLMATGNSKTKNSPKKSPPWYCPPSGTPQVFFLWWRVKSWWKFQKDRWNKAGQSWLLLTAMWVYPKDPWDERCMNTY